MVAFAVCLGFGAWFVRFATTPMALPQSPLDVGIEPGSSMSSVSHQLAAAGIPLSPRTFTLLARLTGNTSGIKAGSYEVESGTTPWQLLKMLSRGDVTQAELTFVEGWTFKQLRAALARHPALNHDSEGLTEQAVLARIGASENAAEGLFFPDTYSFAKRSSDFDLLRRAYRGMERRLSAEWERRDPEVPYANAYQALIAASVIEKETGLAADRGFVASVLVNRLKNGMPLQTDPTVIYGMGERFDGDLRKSDLMRDTPYNTYTRLGLPPTPIAMPGLASIQAALRPAKTEHLYFVARGDGSSEFSRTLEDHNRAVLRYQRRAVN
ncbi:MAG: endolytic transglycosylase MltG [Rhodocyclaceae bacterium]